MKLSKNEQSFIIGITGHAHDSFKNEGIDAGMNRVEFKPCYF